MSCDVRKQEKKKMLVVQSRLSFQSKTGTEGSIENKKNAVLLRHREPLASMLNHALKASDLSQIDKPFVVWFKSSHNRL
jgi:hypothetical protein